MRAILISIRPKWVKKILNGDKTIEIRKTAPKCELPVEVYIYCTWGTGKYREMMKRCGEYHFNKNIGGYCGFNGKVVAKFTLREITEYINGCNVTKDSGYMFGDAEREGVYEKACLSEEDSERYFPDESFKAWHISDLEIFDEPMELSDFHKAGYDEAFAECVLSAMNPRDAETTLEKFTLKAAPQSLCYVDPPHRINK